MLNIPNLLTLARIALIPLLLILMMHPNILVGWSAVTLYIIMAGTDWLDGYIARAYNQGSDLGRMLDPIADKILVAAMFIALAANGAITGWWLALPVIILTREFLVSGLREYMGPKGITVHVSKLAKWKTATQMLSLGFLIMAPHDPNAEICGLLLLLLATILTVKTGLDYLQAARGKIPS